MDKAVVDKLNVEMTEHYARLTEMMTKDMSGAVLAGSERLLARVRADIHEEVDALFNVQRRILQEIVKG